MMTTSIAKLPLAFALTILVLSQTAIANAADHPNILLILVDDMGYGDPAANNPKSKIRTPNIDSIAKEGIRFTDAHAAGSLCHHSRYGLITGHYPFRVNVAKWPKEAVIDKGRMTLASLLKSQGYSTAMVGKWHLGFDENGYENPLPGGPYDCGFDSYFGIRASTDIPPYFYIRDNKAVSPPTDTIEAKNTPGWSPIQGEFWRAGGIAPNLKLHDVLPRFTDEACKVIDNHAQAKNDNPLFLYLAYPAPHTPWLPSKEFAGKSKVSMYGDFAEMVDAMIGKVLGTLEENNMDDNTLVIFSSDNGPVWYEEDAEKYDHDSTEGLRGMKGDAWEGGHRMPFFARWPGKVKPNSVSHQTISFIDMLATFAAVVDVDLPEDAGPDSYNVLPAFLGEDDPSKAVRGPLAQLAGRGTVSIRSGKWKLINHLGSGGFTKPTFIPPKKGDPQGQLYDMEKDTSETTNLYLKHPEVVKELTQQLEAITQAKRSRP